MSKRVETVSAFSCAFCGNEMRQHHVIEDPSVYDGWYAVLCPHCWVRVGRWNPRVLHTYYAPGSAMKMEVDTPHDGIQLSNIDV